MIRRLSLSSSIEIKVIGRENACLEMNVKSLKLASRLIEVSWNN